MSTNCPYCTNLKKALDGHNYCSNSDSNMESIKSNAFYLSSSEMYSKDHVSRLSVRCVLEGYQYYKTGKNDQLVKKDNYLVINEGQVWHSEIDSETPVEMMVVAFHPQFLKEMIYALTTSPEHLLDNPISPTPNSVHYFENTYPDDGLIRGLFLKIKAGIFAEESELFFEQAYFDLLKLIFQKHQFLLKQSSLLPAKKTAVREELFQRLGLAKDYMDAHMDEKLGLEKISRAAALSPFHFLRLFKALYKKTPYQYLANERMKRAKYLITSSSKTVKEVSLCTGFDNHSAFGRVFKQHFGMSPIEMKNRI